jgi:hypothetical protein
VRYRVQLFVAVFTAAVLLIGPILSSDVWAQALTPPNGITITGNEAVPEDYPTDSHALARDYQMFAGIYRIIHAKQAGLPGQRHAIAFLGTGVDDAIPDLAGRVIHRKLFGAAIFDQINSAHETAMASVAAAHAGDPLVWDNGQFNSGAGIAGPLGVFPEDVAIVDLILPVENGRYQGSRVAEALRYFRDLNLPGYQKDLINCSFNCTFSSELKPAIISLAEAGILIPCAAGQNESGGQGGELGDGGPWPAGFGDDPDCPNVIPVTAQDPENLKTFFGNRVQFTGPLNHPIDGTSFVGGARGNGGPGTSGATAWFSGYVETVSVYCGVSMYVALAKLRGSAEPVALRTDGKPWARYGKPMLAAAFDQPVFAPVISTAFRQSKKVLVIQGTHLLNCRVIINGADKSNKIDLSQSSDTQIVLRAKPAKLGLRDVNTVQVLTADRLPSNTFTFPF